MNIIRHKLPFIGFIVLYHIFYCILKKEEGSLIRCGGAGDLSTHYSTRRTSAANPRLNNSDSGCRRGNYQMLGFKMLPRSEAGVSCDGNRS